MLINDDCLYTMRKFEDEIIDMVYLDPPFFTQKRQSLKNRDGFEYNFNDTWDSMDSYLLYLKTRIVEIKRILKKTGSIFLHCDKSASHYLRVLLDEVFGVTNFRGEIIWIYKRWSNSHNGLMNSHQTILYYSKSKKFTFNKLYTKYSPATNIDQILQDRVRNSDGKVIYKKDRDGNIVFTNEKRGVPLSDVWDIPFLNPKARERVGYPTQKPIILLERLIEISTNENDIVLDPFCGSGTTLVAADILNRKYIGIDISEEAVQLTKLRLKNPVKTESNLLNSGVKAYDKKNDIEKQILSNFSCHTVQRNKGIDAFLSRKHNNMLIPIRIQKEQETLSEAVEMLNRAAVKKGCNLKILIKTNSKDDNVNIPPDIIIMDSYQLTIDGILFK